MNLDEQEDHVLLLVAGGLAAGLHDGHHRRFNQKTEELLGVREAARSPDELDVLVAEAGGELDADADVDVHDPGGFEQFGREPGLDEVVVDDPQLADALDPRIHDEVGRGFAALGVDVVDMVVEGDLVPFLGHFQEVVTLELPADDPRVAGGCRPEVVRQFELPAGVAVGPDQLLHGLQQHPGGVFGHGPFGRVDHFAAQRAQRVDAVVHPADFEGAQKLGHGKGGAQPLAFGHLLDAVGVKIGEKGFAGELGPVQHVVDDADQLVVFFVKKKMGYGSLVSHVLPDALHCSHLGS